LDEFDRSLLVPFIKRRASQSEKWIALAGAGETECFWPEFAWYCLHKFAQAISRICERLACDFKQLATNSLSTRGLQRKAVFKRTLPAVRCALESARDSVP